MRHRRSWLLYAHGPAARNVRIPDEAVRNLEPLLWLSSPRARVPSGFACDRCRCSRSSVSTGNCRWPRGHRVEVALRIPLLPSAQPRNATAPPRRPRHAGRPAPRWPPRSNAGRATLAAPPHAGRPAPTRWARLRGVCAPFLPWCACYPSWRRARHAQVAPVAQRGLAPSPPRSPREGFAPNSPHGNSVRPFDYASTAPRGPPLDLSSEVCGQLPTSWFADG